MCVCSTVSLCSGLIRACFVYQRLVLTYVHSYRRVCSLGVCFGLQVGFDPHPHMRVPGMPPSLTGIPGGKP